MKVFLNRSVAITFGVLLGLSSVALAATFTKFQPATGILKGNAFTYVTTAAASSDIVGLWGGTCNASSALLGNGQCGSATATPAGSTTQIQYNNAGALGANSGLTYDGTNVVTLGNSTAGTVVGNTAASTTSAGAALTMRAGPGGSVSGIGGALTLSGGIPVDGNGGAAKLQSADGVGTNRSGGVATLQSGAGIGSASGGPVNVTVGNSGATGTGNDINLNGGPGGATSGNAGGVNINAGTAANGNGGPIFLQATNGVGTNKNGGSITLTVGAPTGSGTIGSLTLVGATQTGAQIATFTANNKPGSGTTAPTLWMRVVVGATTYYIPMWQ